MAKLERKVWVWPLTVLLFALLAACGQAPTADSPEAAVPAPPSESGTTEVTGDSTDQVAGNPLDCEDGFTEVYAELEGLEGAERRERLVELAQQDGQLMVY